MGEIAFVVSSRTQLADHATLSRQHHHLKTLIAVMTPLTTAAEVKSCTVQDLSFNIT